MNERNSPATLTPKQKRTVNQMIERFGDTHKEVKRGDLKKAANEVLSTEYAPAWIVCNKTIQVKDKRGFYDLSILASLPVKEVETKAAAKEKKLAVVKEKKVPVAVKKTAAKKKAAAPKKSKKKLLNDVPETPVEEIKEPEEVKTAEQLAEENEEIGDL